MDYKYKIGTAVKLLEKEHLGSAVVAGYRNSMYLLEFDVDSPELKTLRYPFVGGREFRGLYAAEHQIVEIRKRKARAAKKGAENG